MARVINFVEMSKKKNPQLICLDDIIEWNDGIFDETCIGHIESIRDVDGNEIQSFELKDKHHYHVFLREGQIIIGDIILKKRVK